MSTTATKMMPSNSSLRKAGVGRKRKDLDLESYSGRLAARVVKLREQAGISAKEMAVKLGLPYATYATYENGSADWPNDLTPSFAKVLGISPRTVYPTE